MPPAISGRPELIEWSKRAGAAVRRAVLAAATGDARLDADWQPYRADFLDSLGVIPPSRRGGNAGVSPGRVRQLDRGKVERLARNGRIELVDRALDLVREYNAANKKPAITPRHQFWTFGDLARDTAERHDAEVSTAAADGPDVYARGDGVEIVLNVEADRVQIVFDAKPDRENDRPPQVGCLEVGAVGRRLATPVDRQREAIGPRGDRGGPGLSCAGLPCSPLTVDEFPASESLLIADGEGSNGHAEAPRLRGVFASFEVILELDLLLGPIRTTNDQHDDDVVHLLFKFPRR